MTKVNFLDSSTIEVVALDAEELRLKSLLPVHYTRQKLIARSLAGNFDKIFPTISQV